MKILRGISTVYDKLLNGLATASTELQFDFSKIQSNPFSEEVTQFILNKPEFENRNKILIITPRTDLTKQTVSALEEFDEGQGNTMKISSIYAGAKLQVDADVIIGNYQSIKNSISKPKIQSYRKQVIHLKVKLLFA